MKQAESATSSFVEIRAIRGLFLNEAEGTTNLTNAHE
jgi:hypothetical protein